MLTCCSQTFWPLILPPITMKMTFLHHLHSDPCTAPHVWRTNEADPDWPCQVHGSSEVSESGAFHLAVSTVWPTTGDTWWGLSTGRALFIWSFGILGICVSMTVWYHGFSEWALCSVYVYVVYYTVSTSIEQDDYTVTCLCTMSTTMYPAMLQRFSYLSDPFSPYGKANLMFWLPT